MLNAISGRKRPTSGQVYINSRDLHANFAAFKQDLSVVPQASVLHDSLTVHQSFRFSAELRLPSDLSAEELEQSVTQTLETVGLTARRNVKILQLSGGQLKRAGLGGELLSDPTLLFLDEVTSGLDEHSDGEMMRLFRGLADAGKSLVCITHNLAHVENNCHLVAILTVGGKLAFFGSPSEAKAYFRISSLTDIYSELATQPPEKWAQSYRASRFFEQYVEARRPDLDEHGAREADLLSERSRTSWLRQFTVLLRRTLAVWNGNRAALGTLFIQALLVAVLLCLVFGQVDDIDSNNPIERIGKIRNLLFLVSVSCFWLGCNNSVKELVKERSIYHRERDYNLVPEAYLLSKFAFLAVIGILQSLMLGGIAFNWFGMPGNLFGMLGVLTAGSVTGTALGLAISANAKNEEVAVSLVPIVVIPQIILAGVVAALPSFPEWIARCSITAYWCQHTIESCLADSDRIIEAYRPDYYWSIGVVFCHALAFIVVACLGVRRR